MKLKDIDPVFLFILMGMLLMTAGLAFLNSTFAKASIFLLSLVIISFAIFMRTKFFKRLKEQEDNAFPYRNY